MKISFCFAIFQFFFLNSLCFSQENPITDATNLEVEGATITSNDNTDKESSGNKELIGTTSDSVVIESAEVTEANKENIGAENQNTGQNVNTEEIIEEIVLPIKPTLVPVNLVPSDSSSSSEESDDKLEIELELDNSPSGEDAVVNAAAVITTLAAPPNTKKFILPIPFLGLPFPNVQLNPPALNPSQFLEPLQQKLSHLTDYLTHPNLGFPRPSAIWQKLQQSGNHLFGGGNGGIFGMGQVGGQDYPFPYRSLGRMGKIMNGIVKGDGVEEVRTKEEFVIPLEQAYKLNYVLNGKEVEEFVKNVTGVMKSRRD